MQPQLSGCLRIWGDSGAQDPSNFEDTQLTDTFAATEEILYYMMNAGAKALAGAREAQDSLAPPLLVVLILQRIRPRCLR